MKHLFIVSGPHIKDLYMYICVVYVFTGEANVNFYYISASSLEDKYVGTGAKRLREVFSKSHTIFACHLMYNILTFDKGDNSGSTLNERYIVQ